MSKEEMVDNETPKSEEHTSATEEQQNQEGNTAGEETSGTEEEQQEASTPSPEEEVAAWKDKYMRLHAEFDNFRKRTIRERSDLIKGASSELIENLIPVLDDFDRAMAANEDNDDLEAVKEGFKLIHHKLYHQLQQKGLKPMDSKGKAFDVDEHEALTQIPAPSEDLKGKVVEVVEKGYLLNDRILRYAKVVVGQ